VGRGFCAAAAVATLVVACGVASAAEPLRRVAPQRVYVVVYSADGLTESDRRDLEDAVARGVRGDGKVTVVVPDRAAGVESMDAALTRGDAALANAREQVKNLDLDAAITALQKAAEIYRENLPDLMLRDGNAEALVGAYRELATAQFLNGNDDAASRALAQVFVFTPKMDYDKRFPPQMEEFVVSAGLLAEAMGKGTLNVTVAGGGAVIYVNGEERGNAPVAVEGLPAGPNVVSAVVPGAPTVTVEAEVEGGSSVDIELEVLQAPVAIPPELEAVRGGVGGNKASRAMMALAGRLGVEALVLVQRVEGKSLEAHMYDLRTGRLAGKAVGAEAVELGGAVFGGGDWGIIEVPVAGGPTKWQVWNPDHKYFWHAVGAAAGVVTVVTIGVIAARSGGLSDGERQVVFGLGTKF